MFFVGVWTVVSTAFQVFTSFCPEPDELLRDWKEQDVFSVFLFVFFFFLSLPQEKLYYGLKFARLMFFPSFPVLRKYFAASLKLINGVWEAFLFVTKLSILLCLAGNQWARDNSYIQNCSYYRLPDITISIRKDSIPDSIWLC